MEDAIKPTVTGAFLLIVGIGMKKQSINESQENKFHKVTTESDNSLYLFALNQSDRLDSPPNGGWQRFTQETGLNECELMTCLVLGFDLVPGGHVAGPLRRQKCSPGKGHESAFHRPVTRSSPSCNVPVTFSI